MIKTLWLLECRDTKGYWWQLFTLYAIDENDAETQANHILGDHPHLIQEKLTQQPHGFVLVRYRLPGSILLEERGSIWI